MKQLSLLVLALLALSLVNNQSFAQSSAVKMNEIYSRGVTADPDWIEIYNGSATQIDISGYKIYDVGGQSGTKPKKDIPAGTVIPAKGFFVIVTDGSATSDFGLSSSGETVWLGNASGAIIDSITFTAMDVSQTYGRYPDGASWKLLNKITRGTANAPIMMNEIYSRGTTTDPDWIELYNASSIAINLTGYKIYNVGGQSGTKPKKDIPAGTMIPAKGFFVIVTDGSATSDFGLSSSGEMVWLEDSSGTIIDTVTFAAMDVSQTFGRSPDGGAWKLLNTITRGTSNGSATAVQDYSSIAIEYDLHQNYPNPFNPSTTISFLIPHQEFVQLQVYNSIGQRVRTLVNSEQQAGSHVLVWDGKDNSGRDVSSGTYFYELVTGTYAKSAKMLLLR
ncbi:MAG: lamin tail domain-containing protein [bacterium]